MSPKRFLCRGRDESLSLANLVCVVVVVVCVVVVVVCVVVVVVCVVVTVDAQVVVLHVDARVDSQQMVGSLLEEVVHSFLASCAETRRLEEGAVDAWEGEGTLQTGLPFDQNLPYRMQTFSFSHSRDSIFIDS